MCMYATLRYGDTFKTLFRDDERAKVLAQRLTERVVGPHRH